MSPTLLAVGWLAPLAGTIVALSTIPPLIALYFLRLRRTRRVISSTMLWKRATQDLRANVPFQRLRFSILLLLQLLALTLVILAIAQPQIDLGENGAGRVVLLVDRSGSMAATDARDGKSRLEEAKRLAVERVEVLNSGGLFSGPAPSIMVIAFAKDAQVVCPFTVSSKQAIDAIGAIEATDEVTALGDAFELARAFTTVTNPDQPTTLPQQSLAYELFSDGRIGDLARSVLRGDERILYHSIGQMQTANAGLGTIGVARNPERPAEVQIYAQLLNWSSEPFASDIEVLVDGRLRAVTPKPIEVLGARDDVALGVRIAADTQFAFPSMPLPTGGVVEVRLTKHDAIIADDHALIVSAPPQALRVALVGRGAFVLRSILEGMSLQSLETFSMSDWNEKVLQTPETPDEFDVVVLDDAMPTTLTRGRYLIFHAPPVNCGISPFGVKENIVAQSIRQEHPLLQYVKFDELFIASMIAVAPGGDADVIVEASEGPMIMTMSRGLLTFVYVTFDPMESDWPFQRGFVNFFSNAIAWLAAGGSAAVDEPLTPGDVATARLPVGAQNVRIVLPDGKSLPLASQDALKVSYGPLRGSGMYKIDWTGAKGASNATSISYAVNMNSRAEGRPDAAPEILLATERVAGVGATGSTDRAIWPWLLIGAIALIALEWWVWLRRV